MGFGLDFSFGSMPAELKDILFTVYCSDDGGYHFRLVGIPQGITQDYIYDIKGTSYEGAFAGMEAGDFEVKPVEGFKLSQETEDFKKFLESGLQQIPTERQKDFLSKISDPVSRDPLSYGLTESLAFDARRTKHNLVALGSDSQLNIFEPIFGDMLMQPKFKDILQDFISYDDRWIRFLEPPYSEPNLPRYELKRLIANARANKKVTIFDRATIAAYKNRNSAVSYVERLLDKFAGVVREGYSEPDALKLLGLLTEGERQVALSPNGIRFSQLNPKAQQHLFECCFYNEHNIIHFIGQSKNPAIQAIRSEATYLLPTGISSDAILRVDQSINDMIAEPDEPGVSTSSADANGWGNRIYQTDHPEDYPGIDYKFDKKRKLIRLKEESFVFKLQVSPDCEWRANMSNSERVGSGSFTIDNLPDDLKAGFDAGYKQAGEFAKRRRDQQKNKGGGGSPSRQNRR
jgi:hypothetical protein